MLKTRRGINVTKAKLLNIKGSKFLRDFPDYPIEIIYQQKNYSETQI